MNKTLSKDISQHDCEFKKCALQNDLWCQKATALNFVKHIVMLYDMASKPFRRGEGGLRVLCETAES